MKYLKAIGIFLFWWVFVGIALDILFSIIGLKILSSYGVVICFFIGIYYAYKSLKAKKVTPQS